MPKKNNKLRFSGKEPSVKEAVVIARVCCGLFEYFQTTEGLKVGEEIQGLMAKTRSEPGAQVREMSTAEAEALCFIQKERALGRTPSVRIVAKAAGFKSSRSGARIVNELKVKGYLK